MYTFVFSASTPIAITRGKWQLFISMSGLMQLQTGGTESFILAIFCDSFDCINISTAHF